MNPDTLFSICNGIALIGWIILVFLPKWKLVAGVITSVIIPSLLALVYGTLLLADLPRAEGGFGSLADIYLLFGNPNLLLAAWIHYLAFDLFIGSWEVRDSGNLGISHLLLVPCLLLTFLLGPLGLLCYLAIRVGFKQCCVLGMEND